MTLKNAEGGRQNEEKSSACVRRPPTRAGMAGQLGHRGGKLEPTHVGCYKLRGKPRRPVCRLHNHPFPEFLNKKNRYARHAINDVHEKRRQKTQ